MTKDEQALAEMFAVIIRLTAERNAAQARTAAIAAAAADLQRHRDAWRSYALGQRDRRPSDYLPDLPTPTAAQEG